MKILSFILRKIFFVFQILFLSFFATKSFAAISDGFFFEPFLTLEYSAPQISGAGVNSRFKTNLPEKQLANFENIAIGTHIRIHKFVGLNANWSQTDLSNSHGIKNLQTSQPARFNADLFNFSAMFFAPIIEDSVFEFYGEIGVSDVNSSLKTVDVNNNYSAKTSHSTMSFAGAGFQLSPFDDSKDSIRFGFVRYLEKLQLIDSNLTLVRVGYVKRF